MVKVIELPPPVHSSQFWQSLESCPGLVSVQLGPKAKPATLNWAQAKRLHLELLDALSSAAKQTAMARRIHP